MKHELVTMPKPMFVSEHRRLIKLLEKPTKKGLKKEATEQKKELAMYMKKTAR